MNVLMKKVMTDPELRKKGKEVSSFAGKLIGEVKKLSKNDMDRYETQIDEKQYLEKASEFLKKELSSGVEILAADEKNIYDPAVKARHAAPLRPAIYLE
jgi:leucyl-tRNA synthetase